jgi:AraC family transcriptional regulator
MENAEQPRFEELGPLRLAGLGESYNDSTSTNIPALWQRFEPHIGKISGQVGTVTYGAVYPETQQGNFVYVCAVEVSDFSHLPVDFKQLSLSRQKYAVFDHAGYLSTLRDTWSHIFTKWLPSSGFKIAASPRLERYTANFNASKHGGLEIWIPITEKSPAH